MPRKQYAKSAARHSAPGCAPGGTRRRAVLAAGLHQDGPWRSRFEKQSTCWLTDPWLAYPPMRLALEHIRRMRGGAQAHLMRCDDGQYYVVKFQNNPQHPRVLANEMLGTRL